MTNGVPRVVALAVVTAALTGCGGSQRMVGVASSTASAARAAASPLNGATSPPSPSSSFFKAAALSPSASGPTTCTVYESGYPVQVIFESRSFNVRAECEAWTLGKPDQGYLWGYQPASAVAQAAGTTPVCYLTEPQGNVTASVIEATGFRSVSAPERANGLAGCERILAAGWVEQPLEAAGDRTRAAKFRPSSRALPDTHRRTRRVSR